ncbi:hypothetical protein JHN63_07865, partial [Streptomyces sp. MBT65]|nr:hypothetical protein [Streptomyces sp. MBT65]
ANTTRTTLDRTAHRMPVADLTPTGSPPPAYAHDWPAHRYGTLELRVSPRAERDGGA